ncbi:hypothetical protein JSE7799_00926 [Jannaschia seosinensis]|uniref:Uncharacterized protein n=1 Tax=Jannaschia seosinensis TaxID=313367 RepID=A0A0M7B796_9RHOB|nr:hypothetical protein JSE7799_00926 [Jannaschia seosinensis]
MVGVCGGLLSWRRRRIAWIVVAIRRCAFLRLEALHGRPRLDQRAVHREVFIREQRSDLRMCQDRRHHLARHLGGQQPVAVLAEHRGDPYRVVDAKSDEPPEQQVVIHLLHHLPLRADREQDLEKARPDQALRRDGGAAEVGVECVELGIEARQRVVHDLPDLAKRMTRRDPLIKIHIAEQRSARFVRPAHRRPLRHCSDEGESCSRNRVETGLFQQPVRGVQKI